MANPTEWGPIVWKIIHIVSENLGNNTILLLQNDELNAFHNFVKKIQYVLPCIICRKHYHTFYIKHYNKKIIYKDLKDFAKKYYYDLHDEINKSKNTISISFDSLDELYGSIPKDTLNTSITEFETLYKKYIL